MPKLRLDRERSYFRFPVSLLSIVSGADLRPDSDPDSDGRRLGLYIIAHTLIEKGWAQALRLGEEYVAEMGPCEFTVEQYARGFGVAAADYLEYHRPGVLPAGLRLSIEDVPSENAGLALALGPGKNFAETYAHADSVSDGGRIGGLGINAGPLPHLHQLKGAYWDADHHVKVEAETTGKRSMDANVRADFVRDLAAGRMALRDFRILAAVTAKLGGPDGEPFEQVTEEHLVRLASGYSSRAAFEASCAAFEKAKAEDLAFRESDEFKAWPEEDRLWAADEVEVAPRLLLTERQAGYTLKKFCAPRGVFVSYLYNRRRLYVAHPKRLAKHARENGDDPALTLARLVEEKHARGDERKHQQKAAAAIAKAERAAVQAVRERELAERLRLIEAGAVVSPPVSPARAERVETSGESVTRVSPYIETLSEKHSQEKPFQTNRPHTAADDAAARGRGESRKRMMEDREPVAQAPLSPSPAVPSTPEFNPSASAPLTSAGQEQGETDPTPEPDPPGGGIPAQAPVSEAAVPVPITAAFRPQEGAARAAHVVTGPPPVPPNPEHPPAGALDSTAAFRRQMELGDPGPLYGLGGMFEMTVTADFIGWYVERDRGEVAAERARLAVGKVSATSTG